MGGCLSNSGGDSVTVRPNSSAFVILPEGDLRPYSTPVTVSDVLEAQGGGGANFFLCNSDNLCYDEHIISLDAQAELDAGQIYFILPVSKLRDPLTASEMAALAVKASVALNSKTTYMPASSNNSSSSSSSSSRSSKSSSSRKGNYYNKSSSKISPFVVMETSNINVIVDEEAQNKRLFEKQQASSSSVLGVSRSGSIRKMQRYSSRKARLAVRSFRLRLTTIYETTEPSSSHHRYY